jgi:hypothetical protein
MFLFKFPVVSDLYEDIELNDMYKERTVTWILCSRVVGKYRG